MPIRGKQTVVKTCWCVTMATLHPSLAPKWEITPRRQPASRAPRRGRSASRVLGHAGRERVAGDEVVAEVRGQRATQGT